ncbi:flagellar hook capping FlgD N-terminal domain-containing protein [Peptococcaceae bacterium 1198_IL3148]
MEVKATNNDYYLPDTKTKEFKQQLDKDAFLRIMVEQLKNQDPTSPMDTSQFISQLAEFTTLEQLTNLNSQMTDLLHSQQINQGAALIGNTVTLIDEGSIVTGVVDKVSVTSDGVKVMVNNKAYDITNITMVEGKAVVEQQPTPDTEEPVADVEEVATGGGDEENGQ